MVISGSKVEVLLRILEKFTLAEVMEIEEKLDEQYIVLKELFSKIELPRIFLALVVLNAISSYQLNCKGEDYWREFSEYFSRISSKVLEVETADELLMLFKEFLINSKCNKRLLRQKLRRVIKLRRLIASILEEPEPYLKNPLHLTQELARSLETSASAKTVVFAVKMFCYASRISLSVKPDSVLLSQIDIPLDSRILKISKSLGVKEAREFWRKISRRTGIPPLHLDSLLWIGYRLAKENKLTGIEKFDELVVFLKEC